MDYHDAKSWCQQFGADLAEMGDDVVKVASSRKSHFWLNKSENSPDPILFSAKPKSEFCWMILAGEARAVARDCSGSWQGSFGIHAMCRKKVQSFVETDHCTVIHAKLSPSHPWLGRVERVGSVSDCHQNCLITESCQYWSLNSSVCLLYQTDGKVEKESGSVVGSVSEALGCKAPLHIKEQSRVEYCSCKSSSHSTSVSGYLGPKALPPSKDQHLGRLIGRRNLCPWGEDLVCTDDIQQEIDDNLPIIIEAKNPSFPSGRLNISTCLVYDMRLSVGGHMEGGGVSLPSAQACHNLCHARKGCNYWTWRGDSTKKCFLRRDEGRVVRRAGAAAGSTLGEFGCDKELMEEMVESREVIEECWCRKEENEELDLVSPGYIHPRSLGRIVNRECKSGWTWTCEEVKRDQGGAKLFTGGVGGSAYTSSSARNLPKRQLGEDESKVSFGTK